MLLFIRENINRIKNEPDIWFFYVFLLTFSLSIRKVLFFFPVEGKFNEYTGIYIYISDFFLIIALLNWIFLLYNKKCNLSIYKIRLEDFMHNLSLIMPLILLIWAFISILWSNNKIISLFRTLKLMEYYFLYLYIIFRFIPFLFFQNSTNSNYTTKKQPKCSTWNIFRKKEVIKNTTFQKLSPIYKQNNTDYIGNNQNVPRGTFYSNLLIKWHRLRNNLCKQKDTIDKKQIIRDFSNIETNNSEIKDKFNFSFLKLFFGIIIYSAFFQSFLAIFQSLRQKSIGLSFLKESLLGSDMFGVAKIIINKNIYIRPYGLFPHPNILGGFLLFSIIITLFYLKIFNKEHKKKIFQKQSKCSTWNIFRKRLKLSILYFYQKTIIFILNYFSKNNQNVPRGTLKKNFIKDIVKISLFFQIIALFLSFSKSAIFGLALTIFFILWKQPKCSTWNIFRKKEVIKNTTFQKLSPIYKQNNTDYIGNNQNVPRGTFLGKGLNKIFLIIFKKIILVFHLFSKKLIKKFYIKNKTIIFLTFFILLISFYLFQNKYFKLLFVNSFKERLFYLNVFYETIFKNHFFDFFGTGMGNFVLNISNFSNKKPPIWQYQPIHNIFLLIWSELGIVGMALFLIFIWSMFHVEHQKKIFQKQLKCSTWNIFIKRLKSSILYFYQKTIIFILNYFSKNNPNVPRGTFYSKLLIKSYKIKDNFLEQKYSKNNDELTQTLSSRKEGDKVRSKINNFIYKLTKSKKSHEEISKNNSFILYNKLNILSIDALYFFQGIMLGFIFIGLFDHYLWDIQQGSFLFWITAGLITGNKLNRAYARSISSLQE